MNAMKTKANFVSGLKKIDLALFRPDNIRVVAANAKKGRDLLEQHSKELKLPVHFMPSRKKELEGANAEKLHTALLYGSYEGKKLAIGQKVELALDLANAIVKEYPYTLGYPFSVRPGQVEIRLIDHESRNVYEKEVRANTGEGSIDVLLFSAHSDLKLHQAVTSAFTSISRVFSDAVNQLEEHFGGKGKGSAGNVYEIQQTGTG